MPQSSLPGGWDIHHLWGSLDRPSLADIERQLAALCDHRSSARIGPIEDWHAFCVGHQAPVRTGFPVCVSHRLTPSVLPECVQIESGKVDALAIACLENELVPRLTVRLTVLFEDHSVKRRWNGHLDREPNSSPLPRSYFRRLGTEAERSARQPWDKRSLRFPLRSPGAHRGLENRLQHEPSTQCARLAQPQRVRPSMDQPTPTPTHIRAGPTIGVPSEPSNK